MVRVGVKGMVGWVGLGWVGESRCGAAADIG